MYDGAIPLTQAPSSIIENRRRLAQSRDLSARDSLLSQIMLGELATVEIQARQRYTEDEIMSEPSGITNIEIRKP